MSTATYTIDDDSRRLPGFAGTNELAISRILRSEWTKLRTLPSTWRTAVIAVTISIGLGAILCISQANQWATHDRPAARHVRPDGLLVGGILLGRRRAPRGARRANGDGRVLDGDDPVHVHGHTQPTPGTGDQGCRHRGVRLPGGSAGCRGQLRSRSADLCRQAPRRCPSAIPACFKRWSSLPWPSASSPSSGSASAASSGTPRGRPQLWCWSSSEEPCSASSFRPAFASTCPGPRSRPQ